MKRRTSGNLEKPGLKPVLNYLNLILTTGLPALMVLLLLLVFWRLTGIWTVVLIFSLSGFLLFWQALRQRFQNHLLNLGFLTAISLPSIWPLMQNRLTLTHDINQWHLPLLVQFDKLIQAGAIYPRWSDNMVSGHGTPRLNFIPPAWRYLAETFHLSGMTFTDSINAVLAFSALASGPLMYRFAQAVFERAIDRTGVGIASLLAGLAYAYFPYHLSENYQRGAIGEALFFPLAPLLMLGSFRLLAERLNLSSWLKTSAIFGISLLVYHLQIVIFAFFGGLWLFFLFGALQTPPISRSVTPARVSLAKSRWRVNGRWALLGAVVLGMTLGAIFWLPAIFEKNDILLAYLDQSVDIELAFSTQNLTLFPPISPESYNTNWLGLNQIIAGFATGLIFLWQYRKKNQPYHLLQIQTVYLIGAILLVLTIQTPLFYAPFTILNEYIPLEFPSRLLVFAGFANAFLIGLVPVIVKGKKQVAAVIIVTGWVFISAFANLQVFFSPPEIDGSLTPVQLAANLPDEAYLPVKLLPLWNEIESNNLATAEDNELALAAALAKAKIGSPDATILELKRSLNAFEIMVETEKATELSLPPLNYGGWKVYWKHGNGEEPLETFTAKEVPLLAVHLSQPGTYRLTGKFEDTPVRVLANWSSGLSCLLVLTGSSYLGITGIATRLKRSSRMARCKRV